MKPITDDDLILLYYGEHDNPALAAIVAESEDLTTRFNTLTAELKLADNFVPPFRALDYGADVWQQISPSLTDDHAAPRGRMGRWLESISEPRFSLAGALSFALVAVLAFMLGRNGGQEMPSNSPDLLNGQAMSLVGIDSSRLLTRSVSAHLEQVNLVLTEFVNNTEAGSTEPEYATGMLLNNRLYRQAAASRGKHKLANFLADLEPLLIELAYGVQSGSNASRERMQQEVRDGLLFRVRVMNNQLALRQPEISV